jgi:hypothetical protein
MLSDSRCKSRDSRKDIISPGPTFATFNFSYLHHLSKQHDNIGKIYHRMDFVFGN